MDYIGFTLPILPGKTAAARAFQEALAGPRMQEYAHSEAAMTSRCAMMFIDQDTDTSAA